MSKILGQDLMLFFRGKSIALATNHEIEISSENSTESTKDDGRGRWQNNEVRYLNWTATSDNVYSLDGEGNLYGDLFDKMVNCDVLDIVFAKKLQDVEDVPTGGWSPGELQYRGKCIISDLTLNAPHGEYATFTVNFTGVGELQKCYVLEMNNGVHGGISNQLIQSTGGPYDVRYYDTAIHNNEDVITVDDAAELVKYGIKEGTVLVLNNTNFAGGENYLWEKPVSCRVKSVNITTNVITVQWLDTLDRYQFVDSNLEIDYHQYPNIISSGLSLDGDIFYEDIPVGTLVKVKIDGNFTYAFGEVTQSGRSMKVGVYYIGDDDEIIYPTME